MTDLELLALMSATLDSKNNHQLRDGAVVGSAIPLRGIVDRAEKLLREAKRRVHDYGDLKDQ